MQASQKRPCASFKKERLDDAEQEYKDEKRVHRIHVYSSAVRPSTHATRRIDYTLPSMGHQHPPPRPCNTKRRSAVQLCFSPLQVPSWCRDPLQMLLTVRTMYERQACRTSQMAAILLLPPGRSHIPGFIQTSTRSSTLLLLSVCVCHALLSKKRVR